MYPLWTLAASSRKQAHNRFCLARFWWDLNKTTPVSGQVSSCPVTFTKYLFNKLNINRGMGDGQTEKPDGVSCLIFSLRLVWKEKVLNQHSKLFLGRKDFSQTVSTRLCTGLMVEFLIMSPRSWWTTLATPKMINMSRYVLLILSRKALGLNAKMSLSKPGNHQSTI